MFPAYAADGAQAGAFYTDPTFWVLIAFIIVVGGAFSKVKTALNAALDVRAERISAQIEEARQLKEDAQNLLAEYQRKQRDAMSEADAIVAHAKDEAKRLKADAETKLDASIKRREQQAMDRIAHAEKQALSEVRNEAVALAVQAAEQIMVDGMSAQKANALIDGAIKDLPEKLN